MPNELLKTASTIFSLVCLSVVFYNGIFLNLFLLVNFRWMKTKKKRIVHVYPNIVIIVPVLREQKTVKETILNINSLNYPSQNLHTVFITTRREKHEYDLVRNAILVIIDSKKSISLIIKELRTCFPPEKVKAINNDIKKIGSTQDLKKYFIELFNNLLLTEDVLNYERKKNSSIAICTYPLKIGNKASQLNYFLNHIEEYIPHDILQHKHTYIGVYDADSSPDSDTLNFIASKISELSPDRLPAVFQQTPFCIKNIDNFAGYSFSNSLVLCDIMLQMKWHLGFELSRLRIKAHLASRDDIISMLLSPPVYCVGTGMFINFQKLLGAGKFPEPIEDVPLGYRLSFAREEFMPIPHTCYVESATTLFSIIKQLSNWFRGVRELKNETKRALHNADFIRRCYIYLLFVKELIVTIEWVMGPILFTLSYFVATNFLKKPIWPIYLTAIFCNYPLSVFIVSILFRSEVKISQATRVTVMLLSPMRAIWRTLGAALTYYFLISNSIFNKNVPFPKTER